ncbi:MAG TPA: hypothetical protein VL754_03565 [Verrucomicrobiae bacterium]|jgi:hypothetical protein|nr:hypothetical protein [Verrucomicrobiae bacterium]
MDTASAQKRKLQDGWKILVAALACLTGVFIFLVALASPAMEDNDEMSSETPGLSTPTPGTPGPGNVLNGFQFIPGSAVLVDDHHVIALFQNPDKEFYAVALFSANCDQGGCTPTELIAFSIVDNQGRDVELAKDPTARNRGMGQEI